LDKKIPDFIKLKGGIMKKPFIVLSLILFFSGCHKEEFPIKPIDDIKKPSGWFLLGILPNPVPGISFDSSYKFASSFTHLVPVWGKPSPFYNMPNDLKGDWGDYFVKTLIRGNKMAPLIHFNFYGKNMVIVSPPDINNPTLSNEKWRNAYKNAIIEVVKEIKPKYLSVGNEVNKWLENYGLEGENGFNNWISLYEEIYDTIKKICPDIVIFCTFAREIVKENREADLSFLTLFDSTKIDLLVLTSYPYAVSYINNPSDIPADYYSKVLQYLNKPIAFSEISWWSHPSFGGENGQSSFINLIPELLKDLNVEFVMWPWLCDLNDTSDWTGLRNYDWSEKSGFSEWVKLYREK